MSDDQYDELTIPEFPPPNRLLRVAVDDGLAQMKLVGETTDGGITYIKIPSSIRSATAGGLVDMSGEAVGLYQTDNGARYVCSPDLAGEETRHPDFHISDHDLVLIHHTLIECGYSASDQIELLTALPVDEYFTGGTVNRDRIDQKSENLRRPLLAFNSAVTMPRIVESRVGCQAISAFFDYFLDDEGNQHKHSRVPEAVAVVDIGGSTTDVAVVLSGRTIDQSSSGALRVGVLDVHQEFLSNVSREFGFRPRLSAAAIDRAVRTGSVSLFRQYRDVSDHVKEAVAAVSGQILRDVERKIGNAATLDALIFVGGGAGLFRDVVRHWRGVTIPDDPEFANARGLLKYARSKK